jgi:hypothetical protein
VTRPDPAALGRRLDGLLAAAEGLVREVPEDRMDAPAPGGGDRLRDLAFRLFRLGLGYADGMDVGRFSEAWRHEGPPEDLRDGASVARYGALVRGRLAGWFEGASPREFARVIATDDGPRSGHDLLERVTDEADRRLTRLRATLARSGQAS